MIELDYKPEPKQDADPKELALWVESGWRLGMHHRHQFERMARAALMFWAGDQWSSIISDHRDRFTRVDLMPAGCEQSRRINNQYPIYTRHIISAMSQNTADVEAVPHTYDESDVFAAKLATRFLRWRDREDKEDSVRQLEIMWTLGTGEALRRTYWDSELVKNGKLIGDIKTEIVPFFNYVKDPYSIDQWPPKWLIEFDARTVEWVNDTYDVEVEPENVADVMMSYDQVALTVMTGTRAARQPLRNSVILKRLYTPPSKRYPKGHCWVVANKKLLHHHDLQCGVFPFSKSMWFPIPARLYPLGLIELLMTDQRQLNLLLSQMQEMSTRQLRSDIISAGAGDQEALQRILDKKTGQKQIMLPPNITKFEVMRYNPDWQNGEIAYNKIINDMHEKAAHNKPMLGQDVGREVKVGELQISREADFQSLAWHMNQYNEHICNISRQKLILAKQYYKTVRMIELFGDKLQPKYFMGSDLKDTSDVIAIEVPHLSPAMKQQAKQQAIAGGLAGPYASPQDQLAKRLALRLMGLQDLDDELANVYGDMEDLELFVADIERAAREEIVMSIAARKAQAAMAIQQMQPEPEPAPEDVESGLAGVVGQTVSQPEAGGII